MGAFIQMKHLTATMAIEKHVLINFQQGDIPAFQLIFHTYSPLIYSLAFKILKNREQSEEIVQETFLKAWIHRESLDESKDPWPFFYVIAKRLCFNELRSLKYDTLAQKEILLQMQSENAQSNLLMMDIQQLLKESVALLPSRQQQVWIMSREEGKSHKEIAEELGISPNTVKNCLVQSLKTLRNTFKRADYLYFFLFLLFL